MVVRFRPSTYLMLNYLIPRKNFLYKNVDLDSRTCKPFNGQKRIFSATANLRFIFKKSVEKTFPSNSREASICKNLFNSMINENELLSTQINLHEAGHSYKEKNLSIPETVSTGKISSSKPGLHILGKFYSNDYETQQILFLSKLYNHYITVVPVKDSESGELFVAGNTSHVTELDPTYANYLSDEEKVKYISEGKTFYVNQKLIPNTSGKQIITTEYITFFSKIFSSQVLVKKLPNKFNISAVEELYLPLYTQGVITLNGINKNKITNLLHASKNRKSFDTIIEQIHARSYERFSDLLESLAP